MNEGCHACPVRETLPRSMQGSLKKQQQKTGTWPGIVDRKEIDPKTDLRCSYFCLAPQSNHYICAVREEAIEDIVLSCL